MTPPPGTFAPQGPPPGALVFASDLHLCAEHPARTAACLRLLHLCAAADSVAGLYLLGDVFDLWLGDDDDREPHGEVEMALRALVDSGTAACIQRGNHDLLLDQGFVARTGVQLLADESCLSADGQRLLLMHGDLLCTADTEYLAFRAAAHEPGQQAQFLGLPLAQRLAVAGDLRKRSRSHTAASAASIMDVTEAAVIDALDRHDASVLVHGHTHRPADHVHSTAGGERRRIVLSDWHRPPEVVLLAEGAFIRLGLDALEVRLR